VVSAPSSTPVQLIKRPTGQAAPLRSDARLMPTEGPLVDQYGRVHTDLRISVTDRCNLRCVYCMPAEGMTFRSPGELLTFDEFTRMARIAAGAGITSIRFSGGEPLVRRDVVKLVARTTAEGFSDVALTTNGHGLARLAPALAAAGLRRVNISCDSLRPERFPEIRRRGRLDEVLGAMDAAEAAGLTPLKVNVVVIAGVNDDEILDFGAFARDSGRIVRFIEFMPLDAEGQWSRDRVVPSEAVLRRIHEAWPIEPLTASASDAAPADRFRFTDGRGEIGVVASVTQPFCGTCNRLRLTADGAIRNCLFSDAEVSTLEALRSDATDKDLELLLRQAVWGKLPGHGINDPGFLRPARSMSMIGG
jgi:GTP 3',8-cyclase